MADTFSLEDAIKPAPLPTTGNNDVSLIAKPFTLEEAMAPPKEAPGFLERAGKFVDETYKSVTDGHEKRGIATNVAAGGNETLAKILGAPVDVGAHLIMPTLWNEMPNDKKELLRQEHPTQAAFMDTLSRAASSPYGGSDFFKKMMGLVGANPDDVKAQTTGEKIGRAAGEGAASMAVPGLGAEVLLAKGARSVSAGVGATGTDIAAATLARTNAQSNAFGNEALNILKGSGVAGNAIIGATSGVGSEVAQEHAPDALKPTAALLGGVGGGLAGAGVVQGTKSLAATVQGLIEAATEPAELRAARAIEGKATDPAALRTALDNQAEAPDLVAGSKPTTFQATGDLGVGALERKVAASETGVAPFAARREEQNAARLAALDKLADPQADASVVTDYVKSRLQELTDQHAANVATAAHGVAATLAKAGGESFDNPSAYGEALRDPLSAIHQNAKDATSALWSAINPNKAAIVNVTPLKQETSQLVKSIEGLARKPDGEELAIHADIANLGDETTFGNLIALRSRLTDAMRDARKDGNGQAGRRLDIVLRSVDNNIQEAAANWAADPDQRVGLISRLQNEAKDWMARRADERKAGVISGPGFESGDGTVAPVGAGRVPAISGGEGEAGGQFGVPARNQGLPEADVPRLTQDEVERLATARAATKDMKNTYESGTVGDVLASGTQYGSFKMTASNVAKNLFDNPERLQAFVAAAKDNPEALAPMRDYAAFSLRQAAVKDGMLSPAKYQAWMDDHAYALRQFPDLAPKFAGVKTAQATMDAALGAQKQALTEFQTGALKNFLGGQDPVQAAGRALSNPGKFTELVGQVGKDPTILAGLQRAVVDFMMSKATSTAEAGTSGLPQINAATLQKLFLQNKTSLSSLFSKEELDTMEKITIDLQRANRSIAAVRIPGGSNTAQDTSGRGLSILQDVMQKYGGKAVGAAAGTAAGGPMGAGAGFLIGAAGDAIMAARMSSIDKAITEMMLDPKMAQAWLAKVPKGSGESALASFGRQLRAITAVQVTRAMADEAGREEAATAPKER